MNGITLSKSIPKQIAVSLHHARATFDMTYPPPPINTIGVLFFKTYSNKAPCPEIDRFITPNLSPLMLSVPDCYKTTDGLKVSNILSIILVYYYN